MSDRRLVTRHAHFLIHPTNIAPASKRLAADGQGSRPIFRR